MFVRTPHNLIIRYVVAYVILTLFTLFILLIRSIGTYLIAILVIPTAALITTILISNLIRYVVASLPMYLGV